MFGQKCMPDIHDADIPVANIFRTEIPHVPWWNVTFASYSPTCHATYFPSEPPPESAKAPRSVLNPVAVRFSVCRRNDAASPFGSSEMLSNTAFPRNAFIFIVRENDTPIRSYFR